MKKIALTLVMLIGFTFSANALSPRRAQQEAAFLTDKMAYELDLTQEQIDYLYAINYDYFRDVVSYDDVYGNYWNRRIDDLRYLLTRSQFDIFCGLDYFYRPLTYHRGIFSLRIYDRYARDRYYFSRPARYHSYHGGRGWYNDFHASRVAPHHSAPVMRPHVGRDPRHDAPRNGFNDRRHDNRMNDRVIRHHNERMDRNAPRMNNDRRMERDHGSRDIRRNDNRSNDKHEGHRGDGPQSRRR